VSDEITLGSVDDTEDPGRAGRRVRSADAKVHDALDPLERPGGCRISR
jgi:hypothetical protein